jgi:ligand-binding SRPBCC domain-containing protein
MPTLEVHTAITAPIERVFDLCRSVEAHVASAASTGERPVGGVTRGLLGPGDQVTWSARHFGWRWSLTSRITAFERPHRFRDSMVSGVFARFDHDHEFCAEGAVTHVRDVFDYTSPLGVLGRIADAVVVARHMRRFLERRMVAIQQLAESDGWRAFVRGEGAAFGDGGAIP